MTATAIPVEDQLAIAQQVARSHHLLDDRRWDELVDEVFADGTAEASGAGEPWADFGFDRWVGTESLRQGYASSMARFESAVHATSNLLLVADDDGVGVTARYYVQGWHWLRTAEGAPGPARPADFLVLGRMTDRFRPASGSWRLVQRTLERLGPDVAAGSLPGWLSGLGTTAGDAAVAAGRT